MNSLARAQLVLSVVLFSVFFPVTNTWSAVAEMIFSNGFEPFNHPPVVSNVRVAGRWTDITITFDLADAENDPVDITVEYRGGSAGATWVAASVDGSTSALTPAENVSITWRPGLDEPGVIANDFQIRITPSDTAAGTPGISDVFSVDGSFSLALYLPLDGDLTDHSPNGTDGVDGGATPTTDRDGNSDSAYFFNDTGTQIYVPDTASLDVSALTLSFWFNMTSTNLAREFVNKFGANGDISFGSEYSSTTGKLNLRICTNGTVGTVDDLPTTTTIDTGTWYHFTGTYDGAEMKVYINGLPEASKPKSGAIFNSSEPLRIGRYGYWGGWWFHGTIDEVAIWNRALSEAEVAALYANGGKP